MPKLYVIDREGREHCIEATENKKVMEIIRDASLPIEATCGGICACATCHCYIDEPWMAQITPPDDEEIETLDMAFDTQHNSRLTCQIKFTKEMDGMRVTLGPL